MRAYPQPLSGSLHFTLLHLASLLLTSYTSLHFVYSTPLYLLISSHTSNTHMSQGDLTSQRTTSSKYRTSIRCSTYRTKTYTSIRISRSRFKEISRCMCWRIRPNHSQIFLISTSNWCCILSSSSCITS